MDSKNSMILVKSEFQGKQTFKMLPISQAAPYAECIFDKDSGVFVIISKIRKTGLHMLPKLDDNGDPAEIKGGKTRKNGGRIKEERRTFETFYEFYIEDIKSIEEVVNMLAVNAKSFDYQSMLVKSEPQPETVEA